MCKCFQSGMFTSPVVLLQQPGAEEIEAQLAGRALTAVVFFLDETFEEVAWDMATTVADAVAQLAGLIKLTNYETFTLFESRKVLGGLL